MNHHTDAAAPPDSARSAPASDLAPSDWLRECPEEAFCFSRPKSLVAQSVQAIDSLVKTYRSDTMTLTVEMGRYGLSVDHMGQVAREPVTVNGRAGQVLAAESEIVLLVPQVHQSALGAVKFSMTLKFTAATPSSRELARQMFQSIAFKPPR